MRNVLDLNNFETFGDSDAVIFEFGNKGFFKAEAMGFFEASFDLSNNAYFSGKADQFILENRQEQRKFLDSLAVLAESFVTVVVAAPIFLIVILSVMNSFGGNASDNLTIGYVMILLLMPMAQAGFAWTIKTITPEA